MYKNNDSINRRDFIKMVGIAGASLALGVEGCKPKGQSGEVESAEKSGKVLPLVSKRMLGKTGAKIPILSHGIMYNLIENQIVIYNGLKWGIDMIDTSHAYAGGNSELGLGKFFAKNPDKRKDMFIVSKASRAKSVAEVEERLQLSLKRMKTDYIDLYYGVHAMSEPAQLTDDLRKWAESAKKRKLIRHFGFSTHQNMAKCLMAASKLDWIDALMTSYNFRLMQDGAMKEAVAACHEAGIGLVAMKVMGLPVKSDGDKSLVGPSITKGYTEAQAKLKAVLDDKRFASACVTMNTVDQISENVAGALERKKLSARQMQTLKSYALSTCSMYCPGCSDICDEYMPNAAPHLSDIMRYLMYYNSYNEKEMARELFAEIPAHMRRVLSNHDYTAIEARCPHRLPIGSLMAEAIRILG